MARELSEGNSWTRGDKRAGSRRIQ